MTRLAAKNATVHLIVCLLRFANCVFTVKVVAEKQPIDWHPLTIIFMNFVIAVLLSILVDKVVRHELLFLSYSRVLSQNPETEFPDNMNLFPKYGYVLP